MGKRITLILSAALLASCGGLAHPTSNDGATAGNPNGQNPGTKTLIVNVARTNLMVGDTVSITGSLGGAPLQNTGLLHTSSSDTSVATVGGPVIRARSVGMAIISITYDGYQPYSPIYISVIPR